jgi:hypothetical protein
MAQVREQSVRSRGIRGTRGTRHFHRLTTHIPSVRSGLRRRCHQPTTRTRRGAAHRHRAPRRAPSGCGWNDEQLTGPMREQGRRLRRSADGHDRRGDRPDRTPGRIDDGRLQPSSPSDRSGSGRSRSALRLRPRRAARRPGERRQRRDRGRHLRPPVTAPAVRDGDDVAQASSTVGCAHCVFGGGTNAGSSNGARRVPKSSASARFLALASRADIGSSPHRHSIILRTEQCS